MPRIKVLLGDEEFVSADLETSKEQLPEALQELGRSMAALRDGKFKPLFQNDSRKITKR